MKNDKNLKIIANMIVDKKYIEKAENFENNYQNLLKNNRIFYLNDNIIEKNFSNKFYLGMPLSKLCSKKYASNRCFATALTFSMCFDNCKYVLANLDNYANKLFLDAYQDGGDLSLLSFEANELKQFSPCFMHAFIIVSGEELNKYGKFETAIESQALDKKVDYVVDISQGIVIPKNEYYNTYGVNEKFVYTKCDLENSDIFNYLVEQSNFYLKQRGERGISSITKEELNNYMKILDNENINFLDKKLQVILKNDLYNIAKFNDKIALFVNKNAKNCKNNTKNQLNFDFLQ